MAPRRRGAGVRAPGWGRSGDEPIPPGEVDEGYAEELARAAERTGQDESVITGEGRLRGRRVAVIAGEFGFLAGSIGVAAAEPPLPPGQRGPRGGAPPLAPPGPRGPPLQGGTRPLLPGGG